MSKGDLKKKAESLGRRATEYVNGLADRYELLGTTRLVLKKYNEEGLSRESVYFAYYAFIAVFPLVLTITAVMGFIFHSYPDLKENILTSVYELFPDFDVAFKGMLDLVEDGRFVALVLGVIVFLWSGIKAAESLEEGFDRIWGRPRRTYLRRKSMALTVLMLFGTLTLVDALVSFTMPAMVPWVKRQVGGGMSAGAFFIELALSIALGFLSYVVVYRLVPPVKPSVSAITRASILMAVLSAIIDYVFGFYFNLVYDAKFLYGTLGVMMGVLIWLFVVAATAFLGAVLVWHLDGEPEPPPGHEEERAPVPAEAP